jgi:HK97 family phage prohead protease
MNTQAFSAITVKSFNEETRTLEGMATTPALDRVKDSIKPKGLTFAKEAPLLLNHDHAKPVGTVNFGAPTDKGLPFTAQIAKVDEDGVVKQRVDEAWHSVKSGLIRGVSIGFIPKEYEPNAAGGLDFTRAEVHELSLVAIPCNPEAVITAFKSLALAETAQAGEVPGETPEVVAPEGQSQGGSAASPHAVEAKTVSTVALKPFFYPKR